jgi:hypothetical protein
VVTLREEAEASWINCVPFFAGMVSAGIKGRSGKRSVDYSSAAFLVQLE